MTTVEMLESYTGFTRRIQKSFDTDEERLLLLADMIDSIDHVAAIQEKNLKQLLLYWPLQPYQLLSPGCFKPEAIYFVEGENEMIQFAIIPIDHSESSTCSPYCHFNQRPIKQKEEFIPSFFAKSLFDKIRQRRRDRIAAKEASSPRTTNATTMRDKIDVSYSSMNYNAQANEIEVDLPYYRHNDNFTNGYTLSGTIEGQFKLEMHSVRGLAVVTALNHNTTFSIIVTSSAIIRLNNPSLDSSLRFTELTLYGAASNTTSILPYNELINGFALNRLTNGNDSVLCRIQSNDSLIISFEEFDKESNYLLIKSPCRCLCNIDFTRYSLWYTRETVLPLSMSITLSDFARSICEARSRSTPASYRNSSIKARASGTVNERFDEYGSMETYFDAIDLIARIKVLHKAGSLIPEFFLMDNALSVRQLKRGCNSENTAPPLLNNGNSIEANLLWSVFYNSRALALFDIHERHVNLTPIQPGDAYQIVTYVVY